MNLNLKLKIFPGTLRAPHPAPQLSMTYDRPYMVLLGILHRSFFNVKVRVFEKKGVVFNKSKLSI